MPTHARPVNRDLSLHTSQSRSLRHAVTPEQPTVCAGMSRQATPVRSTYNTPTSAIRSGTRRRPGGEDDARERVAAAARRAQWLCSGRIDVPPMPLSSRLASHQVTALMSATRKLVGQPSGGPPAFLRGLTEWSLSGGTAANGGSSHWIAMRSQSMTVPYDLAGRPSYHRTGPPSGSQNYSEKDPACREAATGTAAILKRSVRVRSRLVKSVPVTLPSVRPATACPSDNGSKECGERRRAAHVRARRDRRDGNC